MNNAIPFKIINKTDLPFKTIGGAMDFVLKDNQIEEFYEDKEISTILTLKNKEKRYAIRIRICCKKKSTVWTFEKWR